MRRDDRVQLRHMRDAAREAVGLAARKRRTGLDDDRMLVFASVQAIESYMGDERRIAVKVIDERSNELMVVREPDA